jgi:hypothetical protein
MFAACALPAGGGEKAGMVNPDSSLSFSLSQALMDYDLHRFVSIPADGETPQPLRTPEGVSGSLLWYEYDMETRQIGGELSNSGHFEAGTVYLAKITLKAEGTSSFHTGVPFLYYFVPVYSQPNPNDPAVRDPKIREFEVIYFPVETPKVEPGEEEEPEEEEEPRDVITSIVLPDISPRAGDPLVDEVKDTGKQNHYTGRILWYPGGASFVAGKKYIAAVILVPSIDNGVEYYFDDNFAEENITYPDTSRIKEKRIRVEDRALLVVIEFNAL